MWRCHVHHFLATSNSVVCYWALTPSHQNPPPKGNQRSRWAVPDLCQCPVTVGDRRQTHIQTRHTDARTHTYTGNRKKGRREKDERQSHIEQDKEATSVADLLNHLPPAGPSFRLLEDSLFSFMIQTNPQRYEKQLRELISYKKIAHSELTTCFNMPLFKEFKKR